MLDWVLLWALTKVARMRQTFEVVVGAGSLSSTSDEAIHFSHRWTPEGVTVEAPFTGAHLLHLAAAGCVLNDLYREGRSPWVSSSTASVSRRRVSSTRTRGSRPASTTPWSSARLRPPTISTACSRSWTAWRRSLGQSGPALPFAELADSTGRSSTCCAAPAWL